MQSRVLKNVRAQRKWNRRNGIGETGCLLLPGGVAIADFLELYRAATEHRLYVLEGMDKTEVMDGIWTAAGGKHTPGFQWVLVRAADSRSVALGGDACSLYGKMQSSKYLGCRIIPTCLIDNLNGNIKTGINPDDDESQRAIETMNELADCVVPGHDLRVRERHLECASGVFAISSRSKFFPIQELLPEDVSEEGSIMLHDLLERNLYVFAYTSKGCLILVQLGRLLCASTTLKSVVNASTGPWSTSRRSVKGGL